MPPYFFLSYAEADEGPAVQKIFRDLSVAIRVREGLPDTEIVGCSGVERFENREEGLRTSRMMLALISSNYLSDYAAERDWHTFEQRKARITRINWSRHPGPLPKAVAAAPVFPRQLNGNGYAPLAVMIAAIGKYEAQYTEFVNNLADYIIGSQTSSELSELDSTSEKVPNTFEHREKAKMSPPPTDPPPNRKVKRIVNNNVNQIIIDGAFVNGVDENFKETAASPATVEVPAKTTEVDEKLSVFAIDDEPDYVEKIETTAGLSGFEVKGYTDGNQLLNDLSRVLKSRREPDLIVINPELIVRGTHNYKLLDALLETKVPSGLLAISHNPDMARQLSEAGISDLVENLPKPFDSDDLVPLMQDQAKIGREKKIRRIKKYQDGRSEERPAFLSHSSRDAAMASKICQWLELREIEVWYTRECVDPGDEWKQKVMRGLARCEVFIALISNNFAGSQYCEAELGIAMARWKKEANNLRVIPVHYNSPTTALEQRHIKKCERFQKVTLSDSEWVPGIRDLLNSVQKHLKRRQTQS